MPSKHLTNVVQNLEKRKFREKYNLFKVEGEKLVEELLVSKFKIERLIALPGWLEAHTDLPAHIPAVEANEREMKQVSDFKSCPSVVALAVMPSVVTPRGVPSDTLTVALNAIQDPGNLGTILRACDWFGIRNVLCDRDCAGHFSSKVVQASAGAIFRVNIARVNLPEFLRDNVDATLPRYGTFLEGENLFTADLQPSGIIVMGNEGHGITPPVAQAITHRLTIPRCNPCTESLNVGVAAGIILSEFKRRQIIRH
jgi:TrmH family RNA methyltransferase